MKTGYVHVYTGDGKGKTTAALGLALRASGAGLRVYFGQFLKKGRFSETRAIQALQPAVTVEQFGRGAFIKPPPQQEDIEAARSGLSKVIEALQGGHFDLVIADESVGAVQLGVLAPPDLDTLIESKPPAVELVLTGRGASEQLLARADVATEMRNLRHYFDRNVAARAGIEF